MPLRRSGAGAAVRPAPAFQFLIGALATVACAPDVPPPDTAPGVSRTLAELRSSTLADLAYDFELSVPGRRDEPVTGSATLSFTWTDGHRRPLVLDFLERDGVRALRVNGVDTPVRWTNEHIVVPPADLRSGDRNRIELDFVAGDGALNRHDDFLYTLFVPDRARFSLPVFDQPDLKGRVAFTLTVPEGWTAVANGPLLEVSTDSGSPAPPASTFRFAASEPLPTYLFAFAAGRFEVEEAERDGHRLRLFHRETDREKVERNLEAVFDLHGAALEWMETYTTVPYPFQKFDFVAIPSFQYGGMEHAGVVLYRASSLFLDASATKAQELGRASVIAHETAHMWFGDLVTMPWFDDVWMKEVFANFMAAKIVHPAYPEIDHDLRFLSHHQAGYEVDRTPGANPIRQALENLNEAGTLYGAIIYQKAPVVMNLLERLVGEKTFQEGLRHYLHAFRYDNAGWPDLVEILDVLSPEDVGAWSRVWVEDAGRPVISARVEPTGAGGGDALVVEQVDPSGQGRVWPQDLTVWIGRNGERERHPVRLAGASVRVEGLPSAPPPEWILPEGRAVGYGRFHLDDDSRAALLRHVSELQPAVLRGVTWLTLWEGVLDGETPSDVWIEVLLEGVRRESDELNLQRILGFLEESFWRLTDPPDRLAQASRIESVLWTHLLQAPTTSARSALFATYRDVASSPDAVQRLLRIWEGAEEVPGVPLSEADRTTLAYALAVREVEGWQSVLDRQGASIENPDRKARFEFVRPALSADPRERDRFFESLGDPARREREPWVLTALRYLHHPLRSARAVRYIQPSLELLQEIQRTGDIFFPLRWLDATLAGHRSPEAAGIVRSFLASRPDYPPRLRAKILQAADPLVRAAALQQ